MRHNPNGLNDVILPDFEPNGLLLDCGKRVANHSQGLGDYPWMVKLLYNYPKTSRCGGVLVSDEWVLTSAECLRSDHLQAVMVGEYDTSDDWDCLRIEFDDITQRVITGEKIINEEYGIGLVNLNNAVRINSYVNPICIPLERDVTTPGMIGRVAGWTHMDRYLQIYNDQLKSMDMYVMNNTECERLLNVTIPPSKFCGKVNTTKKACVGIPGGPFMKYWKYYQMNRFYVGGIMVEELSVCDSRQPQIFLDIAYVRTWITDILKTPTFGINATRIKDAHTAVAVPGFEPNGMLSHCGQRIFNGHPRNLGDHPWLVKLLYTHNNVSRCGGVLVAREWVLTSAECLKNDEFLAVMVGEYLALGDWSRIRVEDDDIAQIIMMNSIIINEDYDAGLINLYRPVRINSYVKPICIPLEETKTMAIGVVAGWSHLDKRVNKIYNGDLKTTDLVVMNSRECGLILNKTIPPSRFCARRFNMLSPCVAMPGGPFVQYWTNYNTHQFFVAGIMLEEASECDNIKPIVFLDMGYIRAWVTDIIQNPALRGKPGLTEI